MPAKSYKNTIQYIRADILETDRLYGRL